MKLASIASWTTKPTGSSQFHAQIRQQLSRQQTFQSVLPCTASRNASNTAPSLHLQDNSKAGDKLLPAIPKHVSIIMDGNGRWAQERGLPPRRGHEAGARAARTVVEQCLQHDIKALTVRLLTSLCQCLDAVASYHNKQHFILFLCH